MSKDKGKKPEEEKKDDAAPAEGDAAAAPKKSKKKLIIIVAGAVVVLGVVGAVLTMGGGDKKEDKAHKEESHGEAKDDGHGGGHGEEDAPCPPEGEKGGHGKKGDAAPCSNGPVYKDVPDLLVNLQTDTRRPRFISLKVTLEAKNSKAAGEIDAVMPRVVDSFNTYLREMTKEELEGSAGLERLETEMMLRLNKILKPGSVTDILFRSVIIQ